MRPDSLYFADLNDEPESRMKIQDFNERLKDSILIADGAMGSMLHEAVGSQRCFDELNSTEPEAVFRVHQAYIEAGAHIIETNTFGANRFKLAPLGLTEEVQRLNSRGVKIAREARESAAREVLIAGSMGPLGLGVQSRHPAPEEIQDIFHEQALALEERGVDFYILETFSYIEELLLAIDAIRSFSGLPIVAQLTYAEEGTTYGDVRPSDAAAQLKNKNVQVIGANCTLGPQALLPILQELAAVDGLRVSGMPNAGFPKREGDRIVYPKSSRRLLRHDTGAHTRHGRSSKVTSPREGAGGGAFRGDGCKGCSHHSSGAGKQILEKTSGRAVLRVRRNRSAKGPFAGSHLRAGRQGDGVEKSGCHRYQ
jgi:methionine synthase I (cobalamin-dependent)